MAEASEHLGLENLRPPAGSRKRSRRVGRGPGSGSGKTAGRGHKGQKARSGGQVPNWFEGGQMPLYRRLPKRGFRPPNPTETQIVNLREFGRLEEDELDPVRMAELGLVASAEGRVKVLGEGEIERALVIRAHAFSTSARRKIEAAGGTAEVLE